MEAPQDPILVALMRKISEELDRGENPPAIAIRLQAVLALGHLHEAIEAFEALRDGQPRDPAFVRAHLYAAYGGLRSALTVAGLEHQPPDGS